jgi:hypothetical protein
MLEAHGVFGQIDTQVYASRTTTDDFLRLKVRSVRIRLGMAEQAQGIHIVCPRLTAPTSARTVP